MKVDTNDTDDSGTEYRDDSGLAGLAVAIDRVEGGTEPGIVRGTADVTHAGETLATRVCVETDDGAIVETDSDRVEVV